MPQGKEDVQASSEEIKGNGKPMQLGELLMKHRFKAQDAHFSSDYPEEISMNRTGKKLPHLGELKENLKEEEEEEDDHDEKFHDPILTDATNETERQTRNRPITLHRRSHVKFKFFCISPSSTRVADPPRSLRELFKKEESSALHHPRQENAQLGEFWWEKAMRMTVLVLKGWSCSMKHCYHGSVDCCVAGLNYRGFGHHTSSSRDAKKRNSPRRHRRQGGGGSEEIREHFAERLDSVRVARPMDCSRDQCGWSQDYSSPAAFSWEFSTPNNYDNSNRQLLQRCQQTSTQSTMSTMTPTTELVSYFTLST